MRLHAALCCAAQVTTALLKFMAEFVLNKTQRLTFDSSSPNGILLFREVSKVRPWTKRAAPWNCCTMELRQRCARCAGAWD